MVEIGIANAIWADRATDLKAAAGHIKLTAVMNPNAWAEQSKAKDKNRGLNGKRKSFHGVPC